jgi:hypothetical protein
VKARAGWAGSSLRELWSEPAVRIVAILLVVVPALTLVVLATLPRGGTPTRQLTSPPIEATQTLSPQTVLFGDRVEARVDVLADASLDPASVHVQADFRPYKVVSTTVRRSRQGSLSLVSTRIELSCLAQSCLPSRKTVRQFRFPPATISFRRDGRLLQVQSPWPNGVYVSSRLGPPSVPAQLVDRPPSLGEGFRFSPQAAQVVLICVTAMLALAGGLLLARGLWPRFFYSRRRWRRLSPLERALLQVQAAAEIDDEETFRRTLEQLATRLEEARLPDLEREVRASAWGAATPRADSLELLVRRIRRDLNGSLLP